MLEEWPNRFASLPRRAKAEERLEIAAIHLTKVLFESLVG
jgi:hypothetical protein